MNSYETLPDSPPLTPTRWILAGLLAAILFWVGMDPEAVFASLTEGWRITLEWLGLNTTVSRWQQGTSHLVTTRSIPVVISYSILYVSTCVLLLHTLLRSSSRTRWVVKFYFLLIVLYIAFIAVGWLGGNSSFLYKLSRRIIDFTVSPLPVMLLLPLLWPRLPSRSKSVVK